MSPIQQMLLGVGSVGKTFVNDVFDTRVYTGNGSNNTAYVNGLDNSTEGGLLWVKARTASMTLRNYLHDTVRGAGKRLNSDGVDKESTAANDVTSFNSNGYTLGGGAATNSTQDNYVAWNFRRAPGFFDIVKYTGSGSARTVDHNLKSVPGMIIVKRLDTNDNWQVYHKDQHSSNSAGYYLQLNTDDSIGGASNRWNNTAPTATEFTVGTAPVVNASGEDYIAYIFGGGEEGYNSVNFGAATESLSATSSDYAFGTGDFTVEAWIKPTNLSGITYQNIVDTRGTVNNSTTGFSIGVTGSQLYFYTSGFDIISATNTIADNQWYHIAVVNNGGTIKAYVNGVEKGSFSNSKNFSNTTLRIANVDSSSGQNFVGSISNVRVVKGTAVYTSAFTSPTAPLTNITNTKLLCCNGDLATSSTVASGSLGDSGNPQSTIDNPFTSPAAVFGDSGKEIIIECGKITGTGGGYEVFSSLGFEAQWILYKSSSASGTTSGNWFIFDSIRGLHFKAGNQSPFLLPNTSDRESYINGYDFSTAGLDVTSTGFTPTTGTQRLNRSSETYIYCAIRRPDGYVGKPPELGTDVFAMDTGNNSSTIPAMDTGFPVDFGLAKKPATTDNWRAGGRLTATKALYTNAQDAESNHVNQVWDSNVGFWKSIDSSFQSWAWKRHAGFDVLAYKGNGSSTGDIQRIPHGLNQIPEMAWIKKRSAADDWIVYNKDLHSSIPEKYYLELNDTASRTYQDQIFDIPTSTHFNLKHTSTVNQNNQQFLMILFSSVSGISKVGSYTGSASSQTITLGFQPRLLIVKKYTGSPATNWYVIDTLRGWGSGDDQYLELSSNAAQAAHDFGAPTSTGMTLPGGEEAFNASGSSYIYYAHV